MTKEEFQNSIYGSLIEKGYKDVKIANGKPYSGKDMYFCPQAPELYMLVITPGRTEIRKHGDNAFSGRLTTQIKGPNDINRMHDEINSIIFNSDHSTLQNKNTGCLAIVLLLISSIATMLIH
jgi:hypothetical protein